MIGNVVDNERLDRIEEQPRMIADALRLRAVLMHAAPQFGQDKLGAGHVLAAQRVSRRGQRTHIGSRPAL